MGTHTDWAKPVGTDDLAFQVLRESDSAQVLWANKPRSVKE